ncbi:sporulation integral membrane protein YlbJ [Sporolactobacillus shoreicorticis]|uniref:Sporulation integral membrane protein YlbJ n=1 Tax=Sporolactobacillus shoreicorticis TaxID=1923877 RepID=A0ABW5S6Q8_9BACL|nr:sporulation integral membrane protein YlbJ [Sporolactobacillus shoreicorticis]MCO7126284.1 sporulation integral membrane protein YlbJ [Sporolactobacillus shoreicorticis]
MNRSKGLTYLLAAGSVATAYLMVRFPNAAVHGSLQGLTIWWKQVFPALFPFFVLAELMIGFGVVNFAGVLMEPIMRPLFRLPGVGGFVLMMGIVSGFPAGARITADLYKGKKITKTEAERLASFTNFSNPLFLFSVTAAGFFHQASLGIVFALSHYIGNICVGLAMRFLGKKNKETHTAASHSILMHALDSMHQERIAHNEPFGKRMGDAVVASVSTLLSIGGFIALFSMLYQLLVQVGIVSLLSTGLSICFKVIGFSADLGSAVVPGLFELTIGDSKVAEATVIPLIERVIVVCGLLGFCGFSIQAQAVSILSQAGLSSRLFLIGRLLQMIFSSTAAFFLYHIFQKGSRSAAQTAFVMGEPFEALTHRTAEFGPVTTFVILIIFICILLRRLGTHAHQLHR